MALSNIFREPRREITESLVGIGVIASLLYADYAFAVWLEGYAGMGDPRAAVPIPNVPVILGMALGAAAFFSVLFLGMVTHSLGDAVCNVLEHRGGIHLRPRNRR